jgi:hypothetical protein
MVSGVFAIGVYVVLPLVVLWMLVQIFFAERRDSAGRRRGISPPGPPKQPGATSASGRGDPPRFG